MDFFGVKKASNLSSEDQQKKDPITNKTFFSRCSEMYKYKTDRVSHDSIDSIHQLIFENEQNIFENQFKVPFEKQ